VASPARRCRAFVHGALAAPSCRDLLLKKRIGPDLVNHEILLARHSRELWIFEASPRIPQVLLQHPPCKARLRRHAFLNRFCRLRLLGPSLRHLVAAQELQIVAAAEEVCFLHLDQLMMYALDRDLVFDDAGTRSGLSWWCLTRQGGEKRWKGDGEARLDIWEIDRKIPMDVLRKPEKEEESKARFFRGEDPEEKELGDLQQLHLFAVKKV